MEDFPGGPMLKPPGIAPVMNEMKRLGLVRRETNFGYAISSVPMF